jgi:hypothetical protein
MLNLTTKQGTRPVGAKDVPCLAYSKESNLCLLTDAKRVGTEWFVTYFDGVNTGRTYITLDPNNYTYVEGLTLEMSNSA